MSSTPSSPDIIATETRPRRGCLFYLRRGLKWALIVLVVLVLLGVAFQTIASELDRRAYAPRGQFFAVNGHQMHLICMGQGSPAVILQAGGVAESLWWHWVQSQVSEHTRVCAYDRPGLGWSESVAGPRDARMIVEELRALLDEASIPGPYVMAGHSYGALLTRIYAARYPDDVAGIVLVDSTFLIPRLFSSQQEFDDWKVANDALQAVIWGMTRTGLIRLIVAGEFQRFGYPSELVPELTALRSANRVFDADYAERVPAMWALQEAAAEAENLGDLPMAVLWASLSPTLQDQFAPYREAIAVYSSNTVTRVIEGADHGSILGNEQYARQVSDAILDVIQAAQTGVPLAQPADSAQ